MGLGIVDTWHGSPDMRVSPLIKTNRESLAVDILVKEEEEEDEEVEEEEVNDDVLNHHQSFTSTLQYHCTCTLLQTNVALLHVLHI